jgi:glycosyltransferase involved in cell wall biosynthesis
MSKISAIIIAKNEENMIADCLDSVSFCDEIIVVDGGSEDRTVEIAKRMGAKVYLLETNDFSKLRNFGLERARGEWLLYVDADERVDKVLKEEISHLISFSDRREKLNSYFLKRKNFYLGTSAKNEWPYIEKLERLFKKDDLKGWRGELHESPIIRGKIGELDGYLLHYTHRDLTLMLNKTIEWSKIEAQLRFKSGHPQMVWWRFLRVMITVFFDWYIRQKGFKLGTIGLIESLYQMFSMFVTYARLWEKQQKK